MNGTASDSQEYRVGGSRTRVRFMQANEIFSDTNRLASGGELYIFDSNTRPLSSASFPNEIVLPAGEAEKNFRSIERILAAAISGGLGRDGCFIGCGGGVVCDMAAFAASIYMRGCGVVLVPTTLLAMVDAAFGGKSGIDFSGYKNMVGTFYPSSELRIAVDFLSTLSLRDFRSGLGEVIKHSLLERNSLRELLTARKDSVFGRERELLEAIVKEALAVKAHVVERDFRENGDRAHLNLGHTFGHALEAVTGFTRFTHGEAVAWGIDKAMRLGVRIGVTDSGYADEVTSLLRSYGFALENLREEASTIVAAMRQDKKKRSGRIRFVLQRDWGDTYTTEVEEEAVLAVLGE